jgi:regulator of sirC expression with transglutaminase-like and TPR domain
LSQDAYQDFRRTVVRPEDHIDLGRAALTIAQVDYPDLDIAAYLARIDELAATVTDRLITKSDIFRSIAALNLVLFQSQGFRGNRDDYFDPKNSFLNEVIDRKRGIPITLSVLYMEVARRTGLRLEGVGFPGHFLVKVAGKGDDIVIDPYNGGEIVGMDQLAKMLYALTGGKVAFHPDFLEPATKKQILTRMLNNLKVIYLTKNDWAKGLAVMDRLMILDPGSAEDLRDRGMIYSKMECFKQALEDLQSYLQLAPGARDAQEVREQIGDLAKQVAQIH